MASGRPLWSKESAELSPWPDDSLSGELASGLVALAGLPDVSPAVPGLLARLVHLTAVLVDPVDYVSVTVARHGRHLTRAASDPAAEAVDLAQYAQDDGPCLTALRSGGPVAVPDIAQAFVWPRFRDVAWQAGVRASLSIPLFAGSGESVAALNLYARDAVAMGILIQHVDACYRSGGDTPSSPPLDAGSQQLVAGVDGALRTRDLIQRAIGVLMGREGLSAAAAYRHLVEETPPGAPLTATAVSIVRQLQL
ncbi:GAF and ANTAR domain-containing protein [Micromonospora sp. RHAY321]|uniref:GAF and ANTAR domain-containing protein n=1 Tax=Micromonospora sp. RHAY321 TaxID=2944807 RepID=UPI00207D1844|nr:GAF and ANTAR domain-containing protein [Micromonospora sp. RHAY321]MCO1595719.1 GAF and ANTAR domain-containing protein [Micromonospora sp. RHAY321]